MYVNTSGYTQTWATTCRDSCTLSSSRQVASWCKLPALNIFWMKAVVSFRRQNVQVSCLKLQNTVWQQSLAFLLLLLPILLWFTNAFNTLQFPVPPVLSSIFDLREPDFVTGKKYVLVKTRSLHSNRFKMRLPKHYRSFMTSGNLIHCKVGRRMWHSHRSTTTMIQAVSISNIHVYTCSCHGTSVLDPQTKNKEKSLVDEFITCKCSAFTVLWQQPLSAMYSVGTSLSTKG